MSNIAYIRRKYDHKGTFLFSEKYEPLRIIGNPTSRQDAIFINADAQLEIKPAYRNQTINCDFGLRENLLKGGDFKSEDFIGAIALDGWGGDLQVNKRLVNAEKGEYALSTRGVYTSLESLPYIFSPTIQFPIEDATRVRISITYNVTEKIDTGDADNPFRLYFRFSIGDFVLKEDGQWHDFLVLPNQMEVPVTAFGSYQTFTVESEQLPNTTPLGGMLIYGLVVPANYNGKGQYLIKNITVSILQNGVPPIEKETLFRANSSHYTYEPEDINLLHGDVIDSGYARQLYRNAVLVNGLPSKFWFKRGLIEGKTIQSLLLDERLAIHNKPRQMISGTLLSLNLRYSHVLLHSLNGNKLFQINAITYYDKSCQYQVELLEASVLPAEPRLMRLLEDGRTRLLENAEPRLLETIQ